MKKLFVCCDGTWNSARTLQDGVPAVTNVLRFHAALAERDAEGVEQRRYYHPGVGTKGGRLRRFYDGLTGTGLTRHVKSAYKWLAANFEEGDALFLVGFSRGAYTARSLGGLIGRYGLPSAEASWDDIDRVFDAYRQRPADDRPPLDGLRRTDIHFIGVWDTVGALGMPLRLQNLPAWLVRRTAQRNSFHDTNLSPCVRNAFHALSVDERREDFQPTLWNGPASPDQRLEQVWFAGVHADVGGGYRESGLSRISLDWMIERAVQCGAAFRTDMLAQLALAPREHQSVLHDSYTGLFDLTQFLPRALPWLAADDPCVHRSVVERIEYPPIDQSPYRQGAPLAAGERVGPLFVYAREHWNESEWFLEPGEYRFEAEGEWVAQGLKCGPEGSEGGPLRRIAAWLRWKRLDGNRWLELIGCVANGENAPPPEHDAVFRQRRRIELVHQHFPVGRSGTTLKVTRPGYLYFFANGAWRFYGGHAGSVQVWITRVA